MKGWHLDEYDSAIAAVYPMLHEDLSITAIETKPCAELCMPDWSKIGPIIDVPVVAQIRNRIFKPHDCHWPSGCDLIIFVETTADHDEILPAAEHWIRFGARGPVRARWVG